MTQIVITGAAGNTGSKVLRHLLRNEGITSAIALLNRHPLENDLAADPRVTSVMAELSKPDTWATMLTPEHVLVETANIRHGNTILPTIESIGIRRGFCVTTTGVFSRYQSFSDLYKQIEDRYRRSPVEITILRPTMIYGNDRDHNMHRLIRFLKKAPVFPVFGGGANLMQPVYVDDLAWGIARAVKLDVEGEFNLGGGEQITYRALLETMIELLGSRTRLLSINHALSVKTVGVLQKLPGFPITQEQVLRLLEDKVFDIDPARSQLGYTPRSFREGISIQIQETLTPK